VRHGSASQGDQAQGQGGVLEVLEGSHGVSSVGKARRPH
jgi:hypothetical protein